VYPRPAISPPGVPFPGARKDPALLRLIALAALVVGVLLGLGELAAPDCRDAAGTAHDSGYPCRIDRSSGKTEYAFSKTTTVTVPYARQLTIGLLIVGVVGVAITRRR
jgi:hypothetical protein